MGSGEFYFSLYKPSKLFELFIKPSDYNKKKLAYKFESLKKQCIFLFPLNFYKVRLSALVEVRGKSHPTHRRAGFPLRSLFFPCLTHPMKKADGLVRMGNELGQLANWNAQAEI